MTDMTLTDPATVEALKAATMDIVLRDAEGREIGRFVPTLEAELKVFGLTVEEYNRRGNAPPSEWVSGDEVVAHLRSLRKES